MHPVKNLVKEINLYKYVASLAYTNSSDDNSPFVCSATIIANKKILTAAHCVYRKYTVTLKIGGTHMLKPLLTVEVDTEREIFVHPDYSKDPVNDIAVIQLEGEGLYFDSNIGKIDLVDANYKIGSDKKVKVLGIHSKGALQYLNSDITGVDERYFTIVGDESVDEWNPGDGYAGTCTFLRFI